jgi:hypothetical protein
MMHGPINLRFIYSAFFNYLRKKWEYSEAVQRLVIDFKKAYDLIRREVVSNILIELGTPMKLLRLIKICLTETYNRVQIWKNLSVIFPIWNVMKKRRCYITIAFHLCFRVRNWWVQVNQDGLQ